MQLLYCQGLCRFFFLDFKGFKVFSAHFWAVFKVFFLNFYPYSRFFGVHEYVYIDSFTQNIQSFVYFVCKIRKIL